MCVKVAFRKPVLKYCLDRYKTQEMCEKATDACLQALKLVFGFSKKNACQSW